MESVLRRFKIKKIEPKENEARIKLQKDLFHFQQGSDHGFPMKSSAISYSSHLDMIAIGTKDGYIKIYGAPGVYYSCQHPDRKAIEKVFFIGEISKIVTYSGDNSLSVWRTPPQNDHLKSCASVSLQPTINHPSSFLISKNNKHMYIGAENGNVYSVCLEDLSLSSTAIFKENVLKNYFEEGSPNPGKVVSMQQLEDNKLLIAYERGLIALYSEKNNVSIDFYEASQSLESLHVHSNGSEFISSHSNGSYNIWNLNNTNASVNKAVATTPFGPFPCKAIKKLIWLHRPPLRKTSINSLNVSKEGRATPNINQRNSQMEYIENTSPVEVNILKSQNVSKSSSKSHSKSHSRGNEASNNVLLHVKESPRPSSLHSNSSVGRHSSNATKDRNSNAIDMFIFSGGMPKVSYGDRQTVTVVHGKRQVVFDVSSKILDFVVVDKKRGDGGRGEAGSCDGGDEGVLALLILAEEEFIAIDLKSPNWPCHKLPYMATLHSSALTCYDVVDDVDNDLLLALENAGSGGSGSYNDANAISLHPQGFSTRPWPIQGCLSGNAKSQDFEIKKHVLLITGHEDGSVKIWRLTRASEVVMVTQYHTAKLFESNAYEGDGAGEGEEYTWPPFRKTGTYDPYSDDPRLVLCKVEFCIRSGYLVTAGNAGQVVVSKLVEAGGGGGAGGDSASRGGGGSNIIDSGFSPKIISENGNKKNETHFNQNKNEDNEENAKLLKPVRLIFGDERKKHTGHEAMTVKKMGGVEGSAFKPVCIVQVYPPVASTVLALSSEWALLAIGTANGFGVVDYEQRKLVELKCTSDPSDLQGVNDFSMSRRKSFKKSLRDSFRRLRSRRSQRKQKNIEASLRKVNNPDNMAPTTIEIDAPKPVERAVEARSADDGTASIVRTLYFAETYLIQANTITATFWAGTNAGMVYIYQLVVPHSSARKDEEVLSSLVKEVHLKHHAPVVSITVVDRHGVPVQVSSQEATRWPDALPPSHAVVICSEEQIKLFSLPNLSAKEKYKLTANEGAKIKKTTFAKFINKSDDKYSETHLVCTTNIGETHVYSIPLLRRQLKVQSIKKDNIMGVVSCLPTKHGSACFQKSPSEFSIFTLSAHRFCQQSI